MMSLNLIILLISLPLRNLSKYLKQWQETKEEESKNIKWEISIKQSMEEKDAWKTGDMLQDGNLAEKMEGLKNKSTQMIK